MPKQQTNRLAEEKSPYLIQHAHNPVDWLPWSEEAFKKARQENKPVFLSIGYSTCHWCHVMAHESFENKTVAELLNRHFVSIKVDREERPDIDQIYMQAVQMMTGQGGWPLSVFLTPDKKPFYGGTYFPPADSRGRMGFVSVLKRITELWTEQKEKIQLSGENICGVLAEAPKRNSGIDFSQKILDKAFQQFTSRFDSECGGFQDAPKFPRSHELSFLLRYWLRTKEPEALRMVEVTLQKMAEGGMHDRLGGGFHRYSTDRQWLIPHFEKMLYDQALLAKSYVEAFWMTRQALYAETASEIFQYVLRDLTSEEGGFFTAEDADSEGEEGKFYAWQPKEVIRILGDEIGGLWNEYYGVTEEGIFERKSSIFYTKEDLAGFAARKNQNERRLAKIFQESKKKLLEARQKRVRPSLDDKIITSWNGLMISSLALGGRILGDPNLLLAAEKCGEFIWKNLWRGNTLYRRYRLKEVSVNGFLDDYAFLASAYLDLYEAVFDFKWVSRARILADQMVEKFLDLENGGFFYAAESPDLILRQKEYYDGAVPSGNSAAAAVFLRLSRIFDQREDEERAVGVFDSNSSNLSQFPMGYPEMLSALDFLIGPSKEIIIAGDSKNKEFEEMMRLVRGRWYRGVAICLDEANKEAILEALPHFKKYEVKLKTVAAYVCHQYVCVAPITSAEQFKRLMETE